MTKAEKIEEFIRETFEMYGMDYEQFAEESEDVENIPKEFLTIKDGLNMYGVTQAAKVLGVFPEDLLNMDDSAVTKWYKKYPYFFHITGFRYAYKRSFHNDNYDTLRLLEVLFDKPFTPQEPTRYNYADVLKRLDAQLKQMDRNLPGTYHKNAEKTGIRIYTENFCHYKDIYAIVESYITIINRVKELFFKAWETDLTPGEVCEYNFLVSAIGITDQEYLSKRPLHYELLKKFIPIYKKEGYSDFFCYVRMDRQRAFHPWVCAEFVSDKELVQKFVNVAPNAKVEMRKFAMMVSKFQCVFTWSDAKTWDMQPTFADMGRALTNLELLQQNGGKELTEFFVPKTIEEMNGDDTYAEKLKVLSGPVKLGGVVATRPATSNLSQHEHRRRALDRITASF